ncbi:MAG: secondary thiamine-phosphate synthase enzyme YjbQ [Candidatus Altiarchaeota archaeon]|nr:secondary thiamine-phosphate synthase enzyme YjbQ [Candidatus Altiarchaeota archaeon]
MTVYNKNVPLKTKADGGMHDITKEVRQIVSESKVKDGIAVIFCPGSTGAVSTVEYEPGLLQDIPNALERIAPTDLDYAHHQTWHDDNGRGHVKATILGPDLTVPVVKGKLVLGTWQQIVFIELDTKDRQRDVNVQVMGE